LAFARNDDFQIAPAVDKSQPSISTAAIRKCLQIAAMRRSVSSRGSFPFQYQTRNRDRANQVRGPIIFVVSNFLFSQKGLLPQNRRSFLGARRLTKP